MLGVQPALGRGFTTAETVPGSRVGRDQRPAVEARASAAIRAILEQPVVSPGDAVHGRRRHAAGLLVSRQGGGRVAAGRVHGASRERRAGARCTVVGRLKPGVTVDAGAAGHDARAAELTRMFPAFNTGWTSRVVPLREQLTGDVRPALVVLLGAVALRAAHRLRERRQPAAGARDARASASWPSAPRSAPAAARLVRQLLAESLVLAAAGGVCRSAARVVGAPLPARRRRRAAADSAARAGRHRRPRCSSSRSLRRC